MINGIDPILIFQFSKLSDTTYATNLAKIPLVSEIPTLLEQPPIPVYLSNRFGLLVDSENKNIDIETDTETLSHGLDPDVNQKGLQSTVTINVECKKDSIILALMSSLLDLCYDKATSKEYAITYLNGPITVFRGKLVNFSIDQNSQTDKAMVKIELSKGEKQPTGEVKYPSATRSTGALPTLSN